MAVLDTVSMLSVAKIRTTDSSYYTFPTESSRGSTPYYERDGTWEGNLRHVLAVNDDKVSKEDLDAIWSGEALDINGFPARGGSKIKNVAFDFTFSTPKSISLLYALTKDSVPEVIERCHVKAVQKSFSYLERQASYVRGSLDGSREVLPCDGLLAAHFLHRVSRSNDPHLHSHLTIANLSLGINNKWSALYTKELYSHIHSACLIYHWDLRFQLGTSLGLEFQSGAPYADAIGFTKMTIRAFSKRSHQIEEGLSETGYLSYRAKQISVYKTRPEKTFSTSYSDLQEMWSQEAAEIGISPNKLYNLLHKHKYFQISEAKTHSYQHNKIHLHAGGNDQNPLPTVTEEKSLENIHSQQDQYSLEDFIQDNIFLLSWRKLTFTRKELLCMCLSYIHQNFSVEELWKSLDKALSSEDIIPVNSQTQTPFTDIPPPGKNKFLNMASRSGKSDDSEKHGPVRNPEKDLQEIFPKNHSQGGYPHMSQNRKYTPTYMHRHNYELFKQINNSEGIEIKSEYFEEIQSQVDTSRSYSSRQDTHNMVGSKKTSQAFSRDQQRNSFNEAFTPKEDRGDKNLLILVNSKRRAEILQNITGEEVLSFEEIIKKVMPANKNYETFANLLEGKRQLKSANSYLHDKIILEDIKKLESSLGEYLSDIITNKKIIYELSNNCFPLILHSLLGKINSFADIELTDSLDLSKIIRSQYGINSFVDQASHRFSKTTDFSKVENPHSMQADASSEFSVDISDSKMRIILIEEDKESFLASLRLSIQKVRQDGYKHIALIADDSLGLQSSDISDLKNPGITTQRTKERVFEPSQKNETTGQISVLNWRQVSSLSTDKEDTCIFMLGLPIRNIDQQTAKNCICILKKPKFISPYELQAYLDTLTKKRERSLYGRQNTSGKTLAYDRIKQRNYLSHDRHSSQEKVEKYATNTAEKKITDSKERFYRLREPPGLSL